MYSALDIAKYIIWYCNNHKIGISNLKMQKILYFIQAEFLVELNMPCFKENIEAWDLGPVVPVVYHKYKAYGYSNIPSFSIDSHSFHFSVLERDHLNAMIEECGKYSASRLVEITHNQSPWKNVYRKYENNIITNESIQDFFENNN